MSTRRLTTISEEQYDPSEDSETVADFINDHVGNGSLTDIESMFSKLNSEQHPVANNVGDKSTLALAKKRAPGYVNSVYNLLPKKNEYNRVKDVTLSTIISILLFDKLASKGRSRNWAKAAIMKYYQQKNKPMNYDRVRNFDDEYEEAFQEKPPEKHDINLNELRKVHISVFASGNYPVSKRSNWVRIIEQSLSDKNNKWLRNIGAYHFATNIEASSEHVPDSVWVVLKDDIALIFDVRMIPSRFEDSISDFVDHYNEYGDIVVLVFGSNDDMRNYVGSVNLPGNVVTTVMRGSKPFDALKNVTQDAVQSGVSSRKK